MIKNKSYFLFPHYNEYSEKTVLLKFVGKVVLRCSGDDFALFLYLSFSVLLAVVSHLDTRCKLFCFILRRIWLPGVFRRIAGC